MSEPTPVPEMELTEGRRALIAQAFGELVGLLAFPMVGKGLAIRNFARSMRAALGERIPDQVPYSSYSVADVPKGEP